MKIDLYVKNLDGELVKFEGSAISSTRGSKYLCKKDFDYYFLELGYGKSMFSSELGLGHRIFYNSYHYHYDRSDRAKFAGTRISNSQKRYNSNLQNFGKPRILLDRIKLEKYLSNGLTLVEMCNRFNCSAPTVSRNISYYKLEELSTVGLKTWKVRQLKILQRLSGFDFVNHIKMKGDSETIRNQIEECENLMYQCRLQIIELKKQYQLKNFVGKSSKEREVSFILKDYNILFIPQYRIDNILCDFYLPEYNTIIEVDGHPSHDLEKDSERDKFLENLGYKVYRINLLNIRQISKVCLQEIESNLLKALGIKGSTI